MVVAKVPIRVQYCTIAFTSLRNAFWRHGHYCWGDLMNPARAQVTNYVVTPTGTTVFHYHQTMAYFPAQKFDVVTFAHMHVNCSELQLL